MAGKTLRYITENSVYSRTLYFRIIPLLFIICLIGGCASSGQILDFMDGYKVEEKYDSLEDAQVYEQVKNGSPGSFLRGSLSSGAVVYTNLQIVRSSPTAAKYRLILHMENSGAGEISSKPLEVRIGDTQSTLAYQRFKRDDVGPTKQLGGGVGEIPIDEIDSRAYYAMPDELIPEILQADEFVYRMYSQGEALTVELSPVQIQRMKSLIRDHAPGFESS